MKILHISDIHLSSENKVSVSEKISDTLKKYIDEGYNINPEILLLTGDFTNKALMTEFANAQKEIEKIKKSIISIQHCILVPGNHDYSWYEDGKEVPKEKRSIHYSYFLNACIQSGLCNLQVKDISESLQKELNKYTITHTFIENSCCNFLIIGMNSNVIESAERAGQGYFENQHKICKKLVDHYRKMSKEKELISIAAFHHHILPVSSVERDTIDNPDKFSLTLDARRTLNCFSDNNISLAVHGHQHQPSIVYWRDEMSKSHKGVYVISAGTMTQERKDIGDISKNSFMVYDVEKDSVTVYCFRDSDQDRDFMELSPDSPYKLHLNNEELSHLSKKNNDKTSNLEPGSMPPNHRLCYPQNDCPLYSKSYESNINDQFVNDDDEIGKKVADSLFSFYNRNKEEMLKDYNNLCKQDFFTERYEVIEDKTAIDILYTKTDIVVLTTYTFEQHALHYQYFSSSDSSKIKSFNIGLLPQLENPLYVRAYFFKWKGYNILNILSERKGSYGPGGSSDIFRFVVSNPLLLPIACISFGVCIGTIKSASCIGDTIISDRIFPYSENTGEQDEIFYMEDNSIFRIANSLRERLRHDFFDAFLLTKEHLGFDVIMGNYLTGESIITEKDTTNITSQRIVAGEMESYGMFKECRGWIWRIPCMIVKSIYDWGISPDFEKYQQDKIFKHNIKSYCEALASVHSSIVLKIFVEKKLFGKTIPELVRQSLLPLRKSYQHVIDYPELNKVLNNTINQKFHSNSINIPISELLLQRLHEEDIIEIIHAIQSDKDTEYVRIVGE